MAASLEDAPAWSGYTIDDARVVAVGGEGRALVYRGRAWREGEEARFDALMSSVYVRDGDGWRLAVYQQTPVPQSA